MMEEIGNPARYKGRDVLRMPVAGQQQKRPSKPLPKISPQLAKQLRTDPQPGRVIRFEESHADKNLNAEKKRLREENMTPKNLYLNSEEEPPRKRAKVDLESIKQITTEEIEGNRLEDVKTLPKYSKHTVGEPSSVLFLKNLNKATSAEDLAALFHKFQKGGEDEIEYQVMDGRMAGLAFVKFGSPETAQEALSLVQGYLLHSNPIVIQFGKKKTKDLNNLTFV